MPLTELIQLFLDSRRQSRAPATVKFYAGRLKPFAAKFGRRELATVTLAEILEYLTAAGDGRSDSTRRHNAVALETLHKFALEQGLLEKPLFKKLEKPPMGQRERLPTPEETAALLAHASPEFQRIYAALRQSGARPGELCRATVADLDRKQGTPIAIVLKKHKTAAKTGKARRIPVGDRLRALIAESLAGRTEGPLFLSPAGRGWRVENLSRTYTRLRKLAGLPADLCLYLARHEHGTAICKHFGVMAARDALGHTSVQTTQRYVHYAPEELQANQDIFDAGPGSRAPPGTDTSRPAAGPVSPDEPRASATGDLPRAA